MEETVAPQQDIVKLDKKKKKDEKEELAFDRSLLAFERTFLSWIRTSTSLLIFGFAIYKLLESKVQEPGTHPVLEVLTPRRIAIILFLAGFFGLLTAAIRHVQIQKRFNRGSNTIYFSAIMIMSYVILSLLFLILLGTSLGK